MRLGARARAKEAPLIHYALGTEDGGVTWFVETWDDLHHYGREPETFFDDADAEAFARKLVAERSALKRRKLPSVRR